VAPRAWGGVNKERRTSVKLFWFCQYYYNFNRIKILKRNPKRNLQEHFYHLFRCNPEDKFGVKRIRLPYINAIKDQRDKFFTKYIEKSEDAGVLENQIYCYLFHKLLSIL
jgi:hypothetical protein